MTAAIETAGLTKCYRTIPALADLDLEVGTGQVFGYLGPNGAGKTTTIRLLLGLQSPDRGAPWCSGSTPGQMASRSTAGPATCRASWHCSPA